MGLAASQARFLAITSRKASCEFQSMQIAQQKLSLTRELEQATEDYNSSLDATKLVYDPSGEGDTTFDFSYDLVMNPSEVNNYTPFMMSRSDGRIALNGKMAQAAKLAGIPQEGGEPSKDSFNKFIEAMVATGGMTETAAIGVRKTGYQRYAGLGGELLDKTQTMDMNLSNLINYIDLRAAAASAGVLDKGNGKYEFGEDYELNTTFPKYNSNKANDHFYAWNKDHTEVTDYGKYNIELSESLNFKKESNYLSINGTRVSNSNGSASYTLSDLLTKDITLAFTKKSKKDDPTTMWKKILGNSSSFLNASTILDGKADLISLIGVERNKDGNYYYNQQKLDSDDRLVLDALNNMVTGFAKVLNVGDSDADAQAFNYAIQETLALLTRSKDLGSTTFVTDTYKACIDGSKDYNCWVYKNSNKSNNANTRAISLTSLAESFLTLYANGKNGFEPNGNNSTPYYITDSAKDSFYVTDDQGYLFSVDLTGDNKQTTADLYNTEYYSILFNSLCNNGWYENSYIDDEKYLQNALQNGQLFITSLNESDGYCYQHRYNSSTTTDVNLASGRTWHFNDYGYLTIVTDEDAITQAEQKYTQLKNKINYKEEELELDMKQLDLEISSLQTEYDSVKGMISKNLEKTFSLFQS